MNRKIVLGLLAGTFLVLIYWLGQDYSRTHSTLYINADIITMENGVAQADAVYVEKGIIVAIGQTSDLNNFKSKKTKVVDLEGATLMPGFIDPHTHPALSSFFSEMVDLSGFTYPSNAGVWSALRNEVMKRTPGEWIICKGLDPILTADLVTPSRIFLDSIAPENPVFIISQSIHSFWANSLAFDQVGIDKNTPDPSPSSYYEKDVNGELSGFLAEQEALIPFRKKITELNGKQVITQTVKGLEEYAKNGNTTIVALGLTAYEQKIIDFYQFLSGKSPGFFNLALSKIGILPGRRPLVRHYLYLRHDAVELLPGSLINSDDHFKILGIKYWYDGAPYTGSMYMTEPYLDTEFNKDNLHIGHNHRGESLLSIPELADAITRYENEGWQVAVHSQGDQSTAEVMQAFYSATDPTKDNRHRIEHCLMIQEDALQQMKDLGVHPSFHINHLYYYGEALQNEIIGHDRAENILPIAVADSLGLTYTLHSDAPMFPSEPLSLIQTAATRKTKEGYLIGQEQAISIQKALEALTINAAWQIKMEDKLGSIKVGKFADFVILDKNPLKSDIESLRNIKVLRAVVAGEDIYVLK